MPLPLHLPVEPMLAKLARELPVGSYTYEPKWDGFRALAIRSDGPVELQSRRAAPSGATSPS